MKRFLVVLLGIITVFALSGCGGQTTSDESTEEVDTTTVEVPDNPYQWDEASSTLTLTNANLTEPIVLDRAATIVLSGDNTITISGDSESSIYAIDTLADVTLSGDGTLNILVTNTSGKAGGIAAATCTVGLGTDGALNIDATSTGSSGRGIFTDNGTVLHSGKVSINARANGAESDAVGIYANAGDITVDENASLKCDCTSADGGAIGVLASSGASTLNGSAELKGQSLKMACGVQGYTLISVGSKATVDVISVSSDSSAYGLSCMTGALNVNGQVNIDLTAASSAGGLWAPATVSVADTDISITASNTGSGTGEAVSSIHNGIEETRANSTYGIAADNGIAIAGSTIKVSLESASVVADGIISGYDINLDNTTLDITATSSSNTSHGIYGMSYTVAKTQSTPTVELKGCEMQIVAGTAAVASDGSLTMTDANVTEGGAIGTIDGVTAFRANDGSPSLKVVTHTSH